jgi:hypothetical protein
MLSWTDRRPRALLRSWIRENLTRIIHRFLLWRRKSVRGCVTFRSTILNVYQHASGREPHMPCHEWTCIASRRNRRIIRVKWLRVARLAISVLEPIIGPAAENLGLSVWIQLVAIRLVVLL